MASRPAKPASGRDRQLVEDLFPYRQMTAREQMAAQGRYDDIVDALTSWHPHVRASKVFGMPCLKRGGRVICGLSRTGMVFKLTDPVAHARALAVPGAHLFDPSGRGEVFRQWVVVPPEQAEEWESLAQDSVEQDHSITPSA